MSLQDARIVQDKIREIVGFDRFHAAKILIGEVTAVDEDNRQCTVDSVLDAETITYSEVNLSPERNDGFILVPAVGSYVICCIMPDNELYVLSCSDIDKVICYVDSSNKFEFSSSGFIFNGGTLDGMVKVNSLVTKLNNVESKLNALLNVFTAWVPVANDGGAALKALTVPPVTTNLTATVKADLENTKIKQ